MAQVQANTAFTLHEVSALELADANIAAFKKKLIPEDKMDLV